MHGLMQTERYARELFVDGQIEAPEVIESCVQARMERQAVMRRPNRPECLSYVHELALRMPFGDAQLWEDQYLRLLFNTHILRIVPANVSTFRSECGLREDPRGRGTNLA